MPSATISSPPSADRIGRQTAELHHFLLNLDCVEEHPKGHTKKVFRYRTQCGLEIGVEKRLGTPALLVARNALDALPPLPRLVEVKAGTRGRNHNLNALDTFKGRPLVKLHPRTLVDARRLLSAMRPEPRSA